MLERGKDIAPQRREILQTFVWWRHKLTPTIQMSAIFCDFADLYRLTFSAYLLTFRRKEMTAFAGYCNAGYLNKQLQPYCMRILKDLYSTRIILFSCKQDGSSR